MSVKWSLSSCVFHLKKFPLQTFTSGDVLLILFVSWWWNSKCWLAILYAYQLFMELSFYKLACNLFRVSGSWEPKESIYFPITLSAFWIQCLSSVNVVFFEPIFCMISAFAANDMWFKRFLNHHWIVHDCCLSSTWKSNKYSDLSWLTVLVQDMMA